MGYDFNNGENTAYSPTYNLSGNWRLSQRLSANLSGTANFQPSETDQNNYLLTETFGAGLSFQATSHLTTSLGLNYNHSSYGKVDAGSPDDTKKRVDNQVDLSARANYQLFRFTSVFVGANFGKDMSSDSTWDYNRLMLETGISLRF